MTALVGGFCLAGSVLAPLAGAAVSAASGLTVCRGHRITAGLGWLSALLSAGSTVVVATHGPFLVAVEGIHGRVVAGLWADQLTVSLVALVTVVGALVQSFSLRYLHGDRRARRFFTATSVVVAAMAAVCASATLAVLVAAWVAAGAAFVVVLGARPDLPGVREATGRAARTFLFGDLALVAASVLVWARDGNLGLTSGGMLRHAAAHLGGLSTPVALLVVVAVLSRSAQGALGRWLPGTVAAPTPTSALLHAGVVNGGGILLVRLGPLAGASTLAMGAALATAAVTAAVATLAMAHRPDVKGGLVFSTMSQMGFMVAECAVGAYLAAVVHVIGHALYKATLFLGAGSQVPRLGAAPVASSAVMPPRLRATAAAATAAATAAAMAAIPGALAHRGALALLVIAAGTAGSASWLWSGCSLGSSRRAVLGATGLVGAGVLYGLALGGLARWIGGSLPPTGAGVLSPWWLIALVAAGAGAGVIARLGPVRLRLTAILVDAAAPPATTRAPDRRAGHGARLVPFDPAGAIELAWEEGAA